MRWRFLILSFLLAAPLSAQPANEKVDYAHDEAVLRGQNLPTKGPELLQILRDRTPKADTVDQFKKHVERLHSGPYVDRVKATRDLRKMGPVVRPLLENTIREGKLDAETMGRLREVLATFPADKDDAAVYAAGRLLQRDKPAGGLRVIIEYIPYATAESARQEVQKALNALANEKSTILQDALKDTSGAKRAAAAEALLRAGGLAARDKIVSLLTDVHPLVRHQLGMTLVELNDKTGLPILIQSLTDAPPERADAALELLYRVAGDKAPDAYYLGKTKIADFCAAWHKWYDANKKDLDLTKQLAREDLGFTIIATGLKVNGNKIFEFDRENNRVRWEFDGPRYPVDVQVLGPNRLLVTEYLERRVTERDFKGNITWQHQVQLPLTAQRLPNGHTFIASRQQLLIVDRDGKLVFSHTPQPASIMAAQRLRDGKFAVVTSGRCVLLDPQGRELKGFNLGGSVYTMGGNIEVLANGRILVPLYNLNAIFEFDWEGNKLWSATTNQPTSVSRLPGGNTLVTAMTGNRVVELDRAGKEVWSYQADARPFRARRR